MHPVIRQVGERLAEARAELGLSTRALAARTDGINHATIYNIERGKTNASIRTLAMLAEVIGVPLTYFFEDRTAIDHGVPSPMAGDLMAVARAVETLSRNPYFARFAATINRPRS